MDWGPVISAGITGVVGLAEIAGTLLSAGMTGSSEDRRAKLADRRRVYASFLATLTQERDAVQRMPAAHGQAELESATIEREQARTATRRAVQEVILVAGPAIVELTMQPLMRGGRVIDADDIMRA